MKKIYLLLLSLCFCVAIDASPKYEMRAAWIATVANIDWPSKEAIGNSELQQKEMIDILDSLQALHFNTIIFQIRPTADALYASNYEPWSSWLTGRQGQEPEPYYDPLKFVVEEAHKRCLDVHVWLNPYRVTSGFDKKDMDADHIFFQHPEWFLKYGDKYYFDPSLDATRKWLNQIVADVVARYDIDAIHFDDYFYPYKIKDKDFPDNQSFKKYPRGFTNKDDWRRNNVNLIIKELQHTIKSIKPWVEFGISPFGVWRNVANDSIRGSNTKAGVQNYDDLYADILLWLEKGWIDYVMPQLYWEIGKKVADYEVLIKWWAQYRYNKNLYIGLFTSQLGNGQRAPQWANPNEICRQIRMARKTTGVAGVSHFSTAGVLANKVGLCDSLQTSLYKDYALIPKNANISGKQAQMPTDLQIIRDEGLSLQWKSVANTRYYVVYAFDSNAQFYDTNNAENILCTTVLNSIDLAQYDLPQNTAIMVTAINHYHIESTPTPPVYIANPIKQWLQSYK